MTDRVEGNHKKALKKLNSEVEELADYLRVNTWPEDGAEDLYPAIVEFGRLRYQQGVIGDATAMKPEKGD